MKKNLLIGVALIAVLFCTACGPSKTEISLEKVNKQQAAVKIALGKYAELRQGMMGDTAVKVRLDMLDKLESVGLGLNDVSVSQVELDRLVRDAYASDSRRQLEVLRSKRTGPEEAQKARTEFYRVQQNSGRPVTAFGVTAKGVDILVAAAHHRAAVANGYRDPVLRKVSVVRRRR